MYSMRKISKSSLPFSSSFLRKYQSTLLSSPNIPFLFSSTSEYHEYLKKYHCLLPKGFQIGTTNFSFKPIEAPHLPANMTLTLICPDEPTSNFAAVFTQNAFPGAPITIGKECLNGKTLGGIIINNKISNVGAKGGGIEDSKQICQAIHQALGYTSNEVVILPSSTGVIGWRLPISEMIQNIPNLMKNMQNQTIYPAATGIMTTDLYPKVRSVNVENGRIVGIAKGAGMIEPNMATMLSYILTDIDIPRNVLRKLLKDVVDISFNSISVDSDESTSDTVALISSCKIPYDSEKHFELFRKGLIEVCCGLAEDVARNGEGAYHLIHVHIKGAPSKQLAKEIGKSVINSPLFKCAIAGNDPNVGRLVMAVGKYLGKYNASKNSNESQLNLNQCQMKMGNICIFDRGEFILNEEIEYQLIQHMKKAQLTETTRGGVEVAVRDFPPHDYAVEIEIDLGISSHEAKVTGIDLTHEYVTINADYRS